jgi:tRNA (cytosine40_48-C5)-methyltransferase
MNIFIERYKQMGESISFITPARTIRVNTNKTNATILKKRLGVRRSGVEMNKVSFVKNAFTVKSRFNVVSTPEYLSGYFYIQSAAAQIPVEILNPKGLVLDAFAAPGGKTTQLAEYCDVIAVEQKKERFQALINNLERLGTTNVIAYNMDFRAVKKQFDYILFDVPCSGNFILEGKKWFRNNSLKRIEERSNLQKELLSHAINLLNKGGTLVYSTCSLEPEENEFVLQYALDNFEVKLEKVNSIGDPGLTEVFGKKLDSSMKLCRRLWPHKTNTIGFFIAKLKKC